MPRVCTVCTHPDRPAIDMALVNHRPFRDIACRFGVGRMAAVRHHDDHLPPELAKAQAAAEVAQADDLLDQVRALRSKALSLMLAAERQGDLRTALAGIREARGCLELLLEVEGELDRRPTLNLLIDPQWLATRAMLLDALPGLPRRQDGRGGVPGRAGGHA